MNNELKLDFFEDGPFIKLSRNNIELIEFACRIVDSTYRNSFNPSHENSSGWLIQHYSNGEIDWTKNKESIEKICKAIDRENSTHLSVSGTERTTNKNDKNPANSQGVIRMVDFIFESDKLLGRIENGDANVVNELAKAVKYVSRGNTKVFSKFSFASVVYVTPSYSIA